MFYKAVEALASRMPYNGYRHSRLRQALRMQECDLKRRGGTANFGEIAAADGRTWRAVVRNEVTPM